MSDPGQPGAPQETEARGSGKPVPSTPQASKGQVSKAQLSRKPLSKAARERRVRTFLRRPAFRMLFLLPAGAALLVGLNAGLQLLRADA
uniref:hypothetical protein n=1 Tax=Arthrobacter sp. TaxID=1667 RepID=UPI00258E2E5E